MAGSFVNISYSGDTSFEAYFRRPEAPNGYGILLLQEIFGVNSHIRSVADDYAAQGFTVLAPDLFWRSAPRIELGYGPDDRKKGMELRKQTTDAEYLQDLKQAADWLKDHVETQKIAAVGYCFGGRLAFQLATANEKTINVAVSYYGGGIAGLLDEKRALAVPTQFHFGENDQGIPLTEVEQIRQAFVKNKSTTSKDAEVHVYDGAGHGFNCDQRESYSPEAAKLARSRALEFLKRYLK